MRIIIMADIHGNPIALEAVLQDVEQHGGVDGYWILGDLVALGHAPVKVLERLSTLPNIQIVSGNTDRYVCTGDRPSPDLKEAKTSPALLPTLIEIAGSFAWTQGAVTHAGWFEWLSELPLELRQVLPDGTRFLGVHATPGRDDGIGLHPKLSETELEHLFADCDADLICVGHTHIPMEVTVKGKDLVNVGSVSNPIPPDLRACYAVLEADNSGYHIEHRRVDYNREEIIKSLKRIRHPGADFISRHMHEYNG